MSWGRLMAMVSVSVTLSAAGNNFPLLHTFTHASSGVANSSSWRLPLWARRKLILAPLASCDLSLSYILSRAFND